MIILYILIPIVLFLVLFISIQYYQHKKVAAKFKHIPGVEFFSSFTYYYSKYNAFKHPREQIEQANKFGKTWKVITGTVPLIYTM
jgi:hypothetical protein